MSDINIVNGTFRSEITVKKSRFICSIKGNVNKDEAEEFVSKIKKEFPDARHNCYAFVLGADMSVVPGAAPRFFVCRDLQRIVGNGCKGSGLLARQPARGAVKLDLVVCTQRKRL